jgi:deoxyhypusine synthase
MTDEEMYERRLNRIYTAIEPEDNLNGVQEVFSAVLDQNYQEGETLSASRINAMIGEYLERWLTKEERAILASAFRRHVPVYIPAFDDSEMGLDFAVYCMNRIRKGLPAISFNPFHDLMDFANRIKEKALSGNEFGIFTVGGGVPRNWAQQVAPFLDIISDRVAEEERRTYLSGA